MLALVLAACGPEPEDAAPSSVRADVEHLLSGTSSGQPPVILITIDTLRADRLSSYGSDRVATPHLDRLATEGIRFANASSTVPFTLPAHSSIMTGLYPPSHGVRENVGYVLAPELVTIAERFRDAGYVTGGFVSAFVLDARWGIGRGFDTYFDDFDLDAMAGANLGSVQRAGPETIAHALEWLDGVGGEEPFFLWLHLFDPHDPYDPPEPFRSEYQGRPYDGEVAYTDFLIGEFRAALEERGLFDESVLVLTSDHGEGLGDHGESYHGFFVYDSTVHVPLIVRLPGGTERGRVVGDAVSHVDIAPTLIELLDLDGAGAVQGRSLLPDLQGLPSPFAERSVYAESFYALDHYGWAPLRSLRTAEHKYIEAPEPELYALLEDPGELANVLLEERDLSRRLRAEALELSAELDRAAPSSSAEPDLDEDTLARIHVDRGELSEAEQVLTDAAEGREPPAVVANKLGEVMALLGRSGDAEARFRQAISANPELGEAHFNLAVLLDESGRMDDAVTAYRQAEELRPRDHRPRFNLGRLYGRQGRADLQIEAYRGAVEAAPDFSVGYFHLAKALMDHGRDLEEAETFVRRGLEDEPAGRDGALGYFVLADILNRLGRPAEERQALARGQELLAGGER